MNINQRSKHLSGAQLTMSIAGQSPCLATVRQAVTIPLDRSRKVFRPIRSKRNKRVINERPSEHFL